MQQLKFENTLNEPGQVPHITSMVTGVPSGRVSVADLENKLASFLRGAGYPVVRVTLELAEVPSD